MKSISHELEWCRGSINLSRYVVLDNTYVSCTGLASSLNKKIMVDRARSNARAWKKNAQGRYAQWQHGAQLCVSVPFVSPISISNSYEFVLLYFILLNLSYT